jgi:hypothetical protein
MKTPTRCHCEPGESTGWTTIACCNICGLPEQTEPWDTFDLIRQFVAEVERRAEDKMLKTGKLEGAHYAAMKQVAQEWQSAIDAQYHRNTETPKH